MKPMKRNKSSNELVIKNKDLQKNQEPTSINLKTDNLNHKQFLFDFISDKNKIIFKSCFDKKGAKQFLSDKNKAMEKMEFSDEILYENDKKKNNNKDKSKKKKKKPRYSISDNLPHLKNKINEKKSKISSKNIKNTHMVIKINYVDDDGKNQNEKIYLSNSKKKISTHHSISSSNIQV